MGASEAHGLMTALLSTGTDTAPRLIAEVLPEIPPGDALREECRTMLLQLLQETEADLDNPEFAFAPLLPEDSVTLQERAEALGQWCEGFLFGLGLADVARREFPAQVNEAISDIGELTRLDPATVGNTEDEEQAFSDLVEFLRVATMLIRDELKPQNPTTHEHH